MFFYKFKKRMKPVSIGLVTLGIAFGALYTTELEARADSIVRIEGENRFETSAKISQESYDQAETVFITDAFGFADALAGVPLAYQKQAPILLAQGKKLRQETINEIKRLGASEAIILGGENAVSESIEKELKNLGLKTRRLAGDNRFETSEIIAKELRTLVPSDAAVLVNGFEFADAMSVAPFAARDGMPIFLTRSNSLSTHGINEYSKKYMVGGPNVLNESLIFDIRGSANLIYGKDRYETNLQVINTFGAIDERVYIATGLDFVDALTGSVLAANNNSPILLVKDTFPEYLNNHRNLDGIKDYILLGGELALPISVERHLLGVADKKAKDTLIMEEVIFELVNELRAEKGVNKLKKNDRLKKAADIRAIELEESYTHIRPDGREFYTVVNEEPVIYDYAAIGENIHSVYNQFDDPREAAKYIFDGWNQSPGHHANMINPNYEEIGIGLYQYKWGIQAVQLFGTEFNRDSDW